MKLAVGGVSVFATSDRVSQGGGSVYGNVWAGMEIMYGV